SCPRAARRLSVGGVCRRSERGRRNLSDRTAGTSLRGSDQDAHVHVPVARRNRAQGIPRRSRLVWSTQPSGGPAGDLVARTGRRRLVQPPILGRAARAGTVRVGLSRWAGTTAAALL